MKLGDTQQLDEGAAAVSDATPASEYEAVTAEYTYDENITAGPALGAPEKPAETAEEVVEEAVEEVVEESPEEAVEEAADDSTETAEDTVDETDSGDEVSDAVQQDEGPQYTDAALARAAQLGWSWLNVEQFRTNAELEAAVTQAEYHQRQRATPSQPTDQKPSPEEFKPFEGLRDKLADFNDELPETLEGMNQHYANVIQKQHQTIAELQQQMQQVLGGVQEQQELVKRQNLINEIQDFDRWANAQEDYATFLGKGTGSTMNRMTPEFANRSRVFNLTEKLASEFPHETKEQLRERALFAVTGKQAKTIARKELQNQSQQQARSAIARPTSRKSSAGKTNEQLAVEFANRYQKERGIQVGGYQSGSFEF